MSDKEDMSKIQAIILIGGLFLFFVVMSIVLYTESSNIPPEVQERIEKKKAEKKQKLEQDSTQLKLDK